MATGKKLFDATSFRPDSKNENINVLQEIANTSLKVLAVKRVEVLNLTREDRTALMETRNRYEWVRNMTRFHKREDELFTAVYVTMPRGEDYSSFVEVKYAPEYGFYYVVDCQSQRLTEETDAICRVYQLYIGYITKENIKNEFPYKKQNARLELYDENGDPLLNSNYFPFKIIESYNDNLPFYIAAENLSPVFNLGDLVNRWSGRHPITTSPYLVMEHPFRTDTENDWVHVEEPSTPKRRIAMAFLTPPSFYPTLSGGWVSSESGAFLPLTTPGFVFARVNSPELKVNSYLWRLSLTNSGVPYVHFKTGLGNFGLDKNNWMYYAKIDISGLFEYYGLPADDNEDLYNY